MAKLTVDQKWLYQTIFWCNETIAFMDGFSLPLQSEKLIHLFKD